MSRTPRRKVIDRLKQLLDEAPYTDLGVRLRVVRRAEGEEYGTPAETLPQVWGGRYDHELGCYTGPPEEIVDIDVSPGQLPLLLFEEPTVKELLALGAAGGGKTTAVAIKAGLLAIDRENDVGAIVALTKGDLAVVAAKFRAFFGRFIRDEQNDEDGWFIELHNGTLVELVGAWKRSAQSGTAVSGRTWSWVVVDESQRIPGDTLLDVLKRGRSAAADYCVYMTATNEAIPEFQVRLAAYRSESKKPNPTTRIVRFSGLSNTFVSTKWWEVLRSKMDPERFKREIEPEDDDDAIVGSMLYPVYKPALHLRRLPLEGLRNITEEVTLRRWGKAYRYVVGQDFGTLVMASVVLKCFLLPGRDVEDDDARWWWITDEINSTKNTKADAHAKAIKAHRGGMYRPESVIICADPNADTAAGVTRSDYVLMRSEGFRVERAVVAERLLIRAGLNMVNSLLLDGRGVVRLSVEANNVGAPMASMTAQALACLAYDAAGKPENDRKDQYDLSHWSAALRYALYPFEKLRAVTPKPEEDKRNDRLARAGLGRHQGRP